MPGWRSRPVRQATVWSAAALLLTGVAAAADDINISQFVFRDLDRDGVYDRSESPFAGVEVRLSGDGHETSVKTSNLSGFANFLMSQDNPEAAIGNPGPVRFAVEVPQGHFVTTGNAQQSAEVRPLAGSPAGLILDPPMAFVGLAPALYIALAGDVPGGATCRSGAAEVAALEDGGELRCLVTEGTWEVSWTGSDGTPRTRSVTLKQWPVRIAAGPAAEAEAGGTVIVEGFDGLLLSENIQEVGAADGLVWHNVVATHRKFYGGRGYINGTVSGQFVGYTSSGHPATIEADAPVEFRGAFVSVAWPEATLAPVRFRAYRGGELVAEAAFTASDMGPVWFEPRWSRIDRLEIRHDTYWQVVLDDVTFVR